MTQPSDPLHDVQGIDITGGIPSEIYVAIGRGRYDGTDGDEYDLAKDLAAHFHGQLATVKERAERFDQANTPFEDAEPEIEIYQPEGELFYGYRVLGAETAPFKTWREAYRAAEGYWLFAKERERAEKAEQQLATERAAPSNADSAITEDWLSDIAKYDEVFREWLFPEWTAAGRCVPVQTKIAKYGDEWRCRLSQGHNVIWLPVATQSDVLQLVSAVSKVK